MHNERPPLSCATSDADLATRPGYRFLLLLLLAHFTLGSILQLANTAFGLAFGELFLFIAPTLLLVRAMNYRTASFLGLRFPPARTFMHTTVTALAAFFVAGAINGLNRITVGEETAERFDPTRILDYGSLPEAAVLILAVVVLAPLGEEILFRGYLLRIFSARYGRAAALVATSAIFALIHLNPASVAALFVLGLVYGLIRLYTGSIWPAVLAHALQNGVSAALMFSGVAMDSPEELPPLEAFVLLSASAPFLWFSLRRLRKSGNQCDAEAILETSHGEHHEPSFSRIKGPLALVIAIALVVLSAFVVLDKPAFDDAVRKYLGETSANDGPFEPSTK